MERLIRNQGGEPFVAPSMREVPLEHNPQALEFAARFLAPASGEFDMVIFLTGVGARLLNQIIETRFPSGAFIKALRTTAVVVRGSKPAAVMREWDVPIAVNVPEPNTWHEILSSTAGRSEKKIMLQEYGRPSVDLMAGLRARGAEVTAVPVYQWDLPEDTGPLRQAAHKLAGGQFDVVVITTSVQVTHLLRIAREEGIEAKVRDGMRAAVLASVGPSASEVLREQGLPPDFEPSHPKMGFLINELSRDAEELLQSKRG